MHRWHQRLTAHQRDQADKFGVEIYEAVPFDPVRVELSGTPQALPDRVSRSRFGVGHFAVAQGVLIYLPLPATHLVEIDRSGRREPLDPAQRFWHHPRYSPDGSHIVLDVANATGERDIWTLDRGPCTTDDGLSGGSARAFSIPRTSSGRPRECAARCRLRV